MKTTTSSLLSSSVLSPAWSPYKNTALRFFPYSRTEPAADIGLVDGESNKEEDSEEKAMPNIEAEFAMNPDPRCACVLLLDTSGSMAGEPLIALNKGLQSFQEDLQEDPLAKRRVEVAIVTFGNGGVQKVQDFVTADQFAAPQLKAGGTTPMGEAINTALDLVTERKTQYKSNGIAYYQPWVFMITDGAPNPDSPWRSAAERIKGDVSSKALAFFGVGVADADMEILTKITPRAIKLDGLRFNELFVWLSQSQKRVSASKPGEQTALPQVTFGAPV
jgi:uncharacterized protein YegL